MGHSGGGIELAEPEQRAGSLAGPLSPQEHKNARNTMISIREKRPL